MFTSIIGTDHEATERVPTSSFPWIWVGFLFAFAFFVIEVVLVIMTFDFEQEVSTNDAELSIIFGLLGLPGLIYWMFCVHRLHKILGEMTNGRYPITPNEAAFKHLVPFYNFYWIFKWPSEFANYLNSRRRVSMISGAALGVVLLLGMLVFRLIDGSIGMAWLFGLTMFMSFKLKAHVKALTGITPDQLPPLPDPTIFSKPIETSASLAQETPERSQVG
jgi:hypothetical protein